MIRKYFTTRRRIDVACDSNETAETGQEIYASVHLDPDLTLPERGEPGAVRRFLQTITAAD